MARPKKMSDASIKVGDSEILPDAHEIKPDEAPSENSAPDAVAEPKPDVQDIKQHPKFAKFKQGVN